ncbi:GNAT family N-acetyltransferase [Micromonospora zhanjiangensis]|uniref:GNAT family N-acetyltransferase n=1 Tax=Micromonospora zhanjiangensis TaxID=1522057 RepID=A0ABV8KQ62_9ACTN
MSGAFGLRHYGADQAAAVVDQLVAGYLAAHADGSPFHTEDRYRRQLQGHLRVPGWTLVTAEVGDVLVGYVYGFPLPPTTRWWDGIQGPVPDGFTREDGHRTFALSELLVHPDWQGRGVARALHGELLGSRSEERATLLARPDNTVAQAAYRSWGYRKVAKLRPDWEHAPTFDVLVTGNLGG